MNHNLELKLQAWLDGELSAAEARRIGQEIAGDAEASRLMSEMQAVKGALAGNEPAMTLPETREFYWSKIERQIQRQAHRPGAARVSWQAVWRRWLPTLAGFGTLGCILLLAARPYAPPAFDETSSTGEGMEAVTFHDQSAGMTVVWLADAAPNQMIAAPESKPPDKADSAVEME